MWFWFLWTLGMFLPNLTPQWRRLVHCKIFCGQFQVVDIKMVPRAPTLWPWPYAKIYGISFYPMISAYLWGIGGMRNCQNSPWAWNWLNQHNFQRFYLNKYSYGIKTRTPGHWEYAQFPIWSRPTSLGIVRIPNGQGFSVLAQSMYCGIWNEHLKFQCPYVGTVQHSKQIAQYMMAIMECMKSDKLEYIYITYQK